MQQRKDLFSLSFAEKDETSSRQSYKGLGREPEEPLAEPAEEDEKAVVPAVK